MHADSGVSGELPIEQAELAVEVFRMLSDTTRVRLLWSLIDEELAVNELVERVGKPAPSVSQHLAKLRMARLVRTRREGTQVFYRLENEHVARLVGDAVYNAEHAGPDVPRHHHDADDEAPALTSVSTRGSRARVSPPGKTS
jgi:ArsR family transcriptional regulator, zinc-responsive transcriptional repressor